MIILFILIGLFLVALVGIVVYNWWRDEQEKAGKRVWLRTGSASNTPAIASSPRQALHPSIDPYLAELLTPPLPQGPGEMAERVYTHLNEWVNTRLTEDALHTVDLEGELLIEPTSRFVDMSRNEAAPPPGYLEDLMKEDQ
jgi:hypothetical protein